MHGIEECCRDRRLPVTRTHEHQRRAACAAGIHSPWLLRLLDYIVAARDGVGGFYSFLVYFVYFRTGTARGGDQASEAALDKIRT